MTEKVAFLGPRASYTHQAALQQFPTDTADLIPCPTIESVFASVQTRQTKYGVVPFENSSNGAVLPTLDLLAAMPTAHPDVTVIAEQYVAVHHCLLGRLTATTKTDAPPTRPVKLNASGFRDGQAMTTEGTAPQLRAGPGGAAAAAAKADLQRLTALHTHPQAWGQCTALLASMPSAAAERLDASSTSAAAALVASLAAASPDGTTTHAAIASRLAASAYGLDVLAENVEDRGDNQTRFLVLGRRGEGAGQFLPGSSSRSSSSSSSSCTGEASGQRQAPATTEKMQKMQEEEKEEKEEKEGKEGKEGEEGEKEEKKKRKKKTLLHFRVPSHPSPGALADALAVFKPESLSLTSMYTRPDPRPPPPPASSCSSTSPSGCDDAPGPWRYIFFVEFGSESGREDEAVERALEALRGVSRGLAVVGSWVV